jgi:uncharacterized protein (TIGR03083 family)
MVPTSQGITKKLLQFQFCKSSNPKTLAAAAPRFQTFKMKLPLPILIPTELFHELDAELLTLLRSLNDDDWNRPTVCSEWSVKDIASHLLDGSIRRVSSHRDGYRSPESPKKFDSHDELVNYLTDFNATWTKATRRISPQVLIQLLEVMNKDCSALLGSLDPFAPAKISVLWAGEQQSLNWFDVAREYTEKWHHQQQIADAVGKTGRITNRRLYFPVLDTFMRALPFTYREVIADDGTLIQVRVDGEAGGDWFLLRKNGSWTLGCEAEGSPTALVILDQDVAWRVFTKRMDAQTALERFPSITLEGNQALGKVALEMVSIMA